MSGKNRIPRIIMQFIAGCIGACGVLLIWVALIIFFDSKSVPEDWNLVLFIIMPVGSIGGIFLIDKLVFKVQGYNVLEMTIGFLLGFVGIAFLQWFVPGYWGVDMFYGWSVFIEDSTIIGDVLNAEGIRLLVLFPLTVTVFSIIGYNIAFWLREHLPHRAKVLGKEGYNQKEKTGPARKEVKGGERIRKIVESFTFKLVSALSFGFLSWAYYGHWSGWAGWIWVIPLVGFAICSARAIKAARRRLYKKQDTQQCDGLRQ